MFLEVIKPILSRTCFLAYAPELGCSRKNQNRGCRGHTFLKKTPGIFRFVSLPLEIRNKMKLHPWKFHQILLHLLEFPRPKTKIHGNSTLFFSWSCLEIPLLFYRVLEFPHSIFSIRLVIPCPQPLPPPNPPCLFFFWNSPLEIVTASQTEICTLLIQQSTCFGQQDNEPKPYCLNFRSGFMSALTALQ